MKGERLEGGGGDTFPDRFNKMVPVSPKHGLNWSDGILSYLRALLVIFGDFKIFRVFAPLPPPRNFFEFFKNRSKKCSKTVEIVEITVFGVKNGGYRDFMVSGLLIAHKVSEVIQKGD